MFARQAMSMQRPSYLQYPVCSLYTKLMPAQAFLQATVQLRVRVE